MIYKYITSWIFYKEKLKRLEIAGAARRAVQGDCKSPLSAPLENLAISTGLMRSLCSQATYDCRAVYKQRWEEKASPKEIQTELTFLFKAIQSLPKAMAIGMWSTVLAPKSRCRRQHISAHGELFGKAPHDRPLWPDVKKESFKERHRRSKRSYSKPIGLYEGQWRLDGSKKLVGCFKAILFSWNEESCPRTFLKWERRAYTLPPATALCCKQLRPQNLKECRSKGRMRSPFSWDRADILDGICKRVWSKEPSRCEMKGFCDLEGTVLVQSSASPACTVFSW